MTLRVECEHLNKGLHILPSANLIPLGFVEICGEILYTSAEYKKFKRERERERERERVGERGKRELEIKRRFGSNATSDREKNKREEGIRAKEREKQS